MTKPANLNEFAEHVVKFVAERVYLPLRERIEYLEAEVKQLKQKAEEKSARNIGGRK